MSEMFWACHKTMRYRHFSLTSPPYDECFNCPTKVPDTLRNTIIPKRKQIFEFNFMPLKLKIVLKDSLLIANQYFHGFISTGTIVP